MHEVIIDIIIAEVSELPPLSKLANNEFIILKNSMNSDG